MNSPATRASHAQAGRSTDDVLGAWVTQRVALIERLVTGVPPREIALAVPRLSSAPRRVVVSGGYFSRHIAQIFALHLDEVIPNVDYARDPLGRDISKYLDLRKDSVVVIFDLRRYEAAAKELAAMARVTQGGNGSLPDGFHTRFYSLTRQAHGAWRVASGGSGP